MPIGICIRSIPRPGPTNWICGRSRKRFRSRRQSTKRRNNMGLQNEKIAALSFVTADLNYLTPSPDRPRTYTFQPPSGQPSSTIVPDPHSVPIYDVRPISEAVSLDRERFFLLPQQGAVTDVYDRDGVK